MNEPITGKQQLSRIPTESGSFLNATPTAYPLISTPLPVDSVSQLLCHTYFTLFDRTPVEDHGGFRSLARCQSLHVLRKVQIEV